MPVRSETLMSLSTLYTVYKGSPAPSITINSILLGLFNLIQDPVSRLYISSGNKSETLDLI